MVYRFFLVTALLSTKLLFAEGLVYLGAENKPLPLPNTTPSDQFYFGFSNETHIYEYQSQTNSSKYLLFENALYSELDVYFRKNINGNFELLESAGMYRPTNPNLPYIGGFVFQTTKEGIYRFKIRTDDAHRIKFRIYSNEEFIDYCRILSIWQGLYIGLCIFVFLIAITQWWFIREKIYLYLSFATLVILYVNLIRSGILHQYYLGDFPSLFKYLPSLISFSPFSLMLFIREFIGSRNKFPILDRWIVGYLIFLFFSAFFIIFGFQLYFKFIYTNTLLFSIFTLCLTIYFLTEKTEYGKVLFYAVITRQIGTAIYICMNLGTLPHNPITGSANEIGAALQMLIFTAAISKFQIQQRIQKEKIVTKENLELGALVSEKDNEVYRKKEELEKALRQIRETEHQLIHSEKLSELGRLIAGVAHELNNPLSAIKASIETLIDSKDKEIQKLNEKEAVLTKLNEEEKNTLKHILSTRSEFGIVASYTERKEKRNILKQLLVQNNLDYDSDIIEKFLDVGVTTLSPSEINLLRTNKDSLRNFLLDEKNNYLHLSIVQIAADRASLIINALKNFSRTPKNEDKRKFSILENIETVLLIYQYRMRGKVSIKKTFLTDANIFGWPEDMMRVWTNVILNALYAMNEKGNIMIFVEKKDYYVSVRIIDNGPGIPLEIQKKIFEPFFTTKNANEGSGMGLEITKTIIERHHGKIVLESEPGHTCFQFLIPVDCFVEVG
ncbi:ATP-binding protein [Leptospira sp. 96542]|nr:ATP-binding protein [Leptospira sp. 96542]